MMSSTNENIKEKRKIDLDTILVEEIGQIGPFQIRLLIILVILSMFRAWSSSEYVFSTARINSRCYIPGCDGEAEDALYSPAWVLSAVPSAGGSLASCQRYANITQLTQNYTCTPQLFNTSHIIPCDTYVYENTDTIVYDFNLACDEWLRSLIGSVRMAAMWISLPLTGYISDRWGRRTALAFNAINAAVFGIIRYWANSYIFFLASVFLESALAGSVYTCGYVIVAETMSPKYREASMASTNTFYSFGQITMALIAMSVQNWRKLILALYLPQFLSIATVFILSESVRWSMSKGRYDYAEKVIKKIAKCNNKSISQESLDEMRFNHIEKMKEEREAKKNDSEWLLVLLVKNKTLLFRSLVTGVIWIASVLIYHGLSLNATGLSGNIYLNYSAAVALEIPGFWFAAFVLNKIGRKPTLSGALFFCAAFQAAYVFISTDNHAMSLTVYLLSKFTSGVMVLSMYIYTVELYPTEHRHRLLALSSFMGRFGSVLAPLTPAFGAATFDELPFVIFGSSALIAGLLTLFLPETLNTKLPDTMREAETLGKKTNL